MTSICIFFNRRRLKSPSSKNSTLPKAKHQRQQFSAARTAVYERRKKAARTRRSPRAIPALHRKEPPTTTLALRQPGSSQALPPWCSACCRSIDRSQNTAPPLWHRRSQITPDHWETAKAISTPVAPMDATVTAKRPKTADPTDDFLINIPPRRIMCSHYTQHHTGWQALADRGYRQVQNGHTNACRFIRQAPLFTLHKALSTHD